MVIAVSNPQNCASQSKLTIFSHIAKPKYRCPRCRTQTCSVMCYKRHQQRAACDGKRNPATYVKKSQWATPAGIDHDYNYLKSVERKIDSAGQNAYERGIGFEAQSSKRAARARQPGSQIHKYLMQNRIHVEHAPVGMSRQKTNQTRVTKGGKVAWTVEWVDPSGVRIWKNDCVATDTVEDLHAALEVERRNAQARSKGLKAALKDHRGVKRKLGQVESGPLVQPEIHVQKASQSLESRKVEDQAEADAIQKPNSSVDEDGHDSASSPSSMHQSQDREIRQTPQASNDQEDLTNGDPHETHTSAEPQHSNVPNDGTAQTPRSQRNQPDAPSQPPRPQTNAPNLSAPQDQKKKNNRHYYYLLKPATNSTLPILIPLAPTTTLTTALQDKTILEYPTIYTLLEPPEKLPNGFKLEAEYVREMQERNQRWRTGGGDGRVMTDGRESRADGGDEELDASGILDLLRR